MMIFIGESCVFKNTVGLADESHGKARSLRSYLHHHHIRWQRSPIKIDGTIDVLLLLLTMQLQNSWKFDFYIAVRQFRRPSSNSGEHSIPNHFEQLKPHVKSSCSNDNKEIAADNTRLLMVERWWYDPISQFSRAPQIGGEMVQAGKDAIGFKPRLVCIGVSRANRNAPNTAVRDVITPAIAVRFSCRVCEGK